jgi:hypothetical protein
VIPHIILSHRFISHVHSLGASLIPDSVMQPFYSSTLCIPEHCSTSSPSSHVSALLECGTVLTLTRTVDRLLF